MFNDKPSQREVRKPGKDLAVGDLMRFLTDHRLVLGFAPDDRPGHRTAILEAKDGNDGGMEITVPDDEDVEVLVEDKPQALSLADLLDRIM